MFRKDYTTISAIFAEIVLEVMTTMIECNLPQKYITNIFNKVKVEQSGLSATFIGDVEKAFVTVAAIKALGFSRKAQDYLAVNKQINIDEEMRK